MTRTLHLHILADQCLSPMQCDDNCGECCGIVPVAEDEWNQIAEYINAHGITPQPQGVTCPFHQKGKCAIYAVRPVMCRVFGHCEKMECCRGHNVNADAPIVDRIMGEYAPNADAYGLLHGFAYSDKGLKRMLETL